MLSPMFEQIINCEKPLDAYLCLHLQGPVRFKDNSRRGNVVIKQMVLQTVRKFTLTKTVTPMGVRDFMHIFDTCLIQIRVEFDHEPFDLEDS